MARIGFIGIGNMGGPMVRNLIAAGHEVAVFDLVAEAVRRAVEGGASAAGGIGDAAAGRDVVVTMLPAGEHVRAVYLDDGGVLGAADAGTTLIDSSTIDVATARAVGAASSAAGFGMIDAPVSGGVGGAEAGTLTFMCGGPDAAFAAAKPFLEAMGKTIIHAGPSGNGQAAKICNNQILAASMIAVGEAFVMAEKLGLDHQVLFDIVSTATGRCWALNDYCPVPGPVPTSPANRDYQPGFTVAMMAKDLRLAQGAVQQIGAATPVGSAACAAYNLFEANGHGAMDFSGIIKMIRGDA